MIFGEDDEDFDEDMAELFQEFVEDGNERFSAIDQTSFPEDGVTIAKEAHKLKGSAANFGFQKVADLLAHIEDDIKTITAEDYAATLSGARRAFEESVKILQSRYPALT